jgi:7-cyano-7-deazaguanine synthase
MGKGLAPHGSSMKRGSSSSNKAAERPQVLVLLSGGVDSAACVAFYRSQQYDVSALFIEYGQGALMQERRASRLIAKQGAVPLSTVRIVGLGPFGNGYIPARNSLLVTAALSHWQTRTGMIALGIHAGTSYADCSQGFVEACQRVFDVYTDGRARLACPFLNWTKAQIWEFCREADVPVELTYSCEKGGNRPCGRCLSCRDRRALRELR